MSMINRTDLSGLIPEPITREIIQGVTEQSAVLNMGRKLPNMTSKTQTLNVLDALPTAYWVDGDNGHKKTSKQMWDKKKIYAEELAVIIPIPEAVLDDSNYDIWGEIKPRIVEAFGKKIDDAILFGNGKPATWRQSIVDTAIAAGNYVSASTDVFADIMAEGGVIAKAEESGFMPTGVMSSVSMRAKLRGLRDEQGQPIFASSMQGVPSYSLDGMQMSFPMNGAFDSSKALMIVGDFSQLCYAIRQDVTYKILTEATIVDPETNAVLYSLAQQDMVALRAVMRLGWEIPNPINAFNEGIVNRCPFAVYTPAVDNGLLVSANISRSTDLLGKKVYDLQNSVALDGRAIKGNLNYVTGYTGYSGVAEEQEGNYLALHTVADNGATITCSYNGRTVTLDSDGLTITRVVDKNLPLTFTATKGTTVQTKTYSLHSLSLD